MIECNRCHKLLSSKQFYRTARGRVQQPCRLCFSEKRRDKIAEHASLSATLTAIQPPVVSLAATDLDMY